MQWTELAYPKEADMHKVTTSPKVKIDSSTDVDIGYIKFYRSGDKIGEDALSVLPRHIASRVLESGTMSLT